MHRSSARRLAVILLSFGFTAGCASYPARDKISKFGETASELARNANSAYEDSIDIASQLAEERAAQAYISGSGLFTPDYESENLTTQESWAIRLNALEAVKAYAEELASIGEPGSASKAGAAAAGLVDAGITLIASIGGVLPPGVAAGAPGIASGAVNMATNAFLATRMRSVMRRTDPVLKETVDVLAEDFEILAGEPTRKADELEHARREGLYLLRATRRATSYELRQAFFQNLAELEDTQEFKERIAALPGALRKLAAAHAEVASSRDDERALSEFIEAAGAIGEGVKALKGN